MANRIKGITVEIGGDTTGLSKALSGVNKEIKNTQTQLKDVERLLKLDPGNIELLEQKQRLLSKAVEDTGSKLKSLKEAEKQVQEQFKRGEVSQEQYEGLRREIIQTAKEYDDLSQQARENAKALQSTDRNANNAEQELKDLKTAAQGANRELKDSKSAAATFQSSAKKIQTSAKNIANKLQPLSTGALGLAAGMVAAHESTLELRSDLSKLDTNARQNAVSVDESRKAWKNFVVVTDEADSSVEAVSNLLSAGFTESDLEVAVRGLSGAVLKFPDTLKIESLADSIQETIATGSATGQYAELLDRLGVSADEFNKQMENATTEAERQDLVLQTLSENGLADYYDSWKEANEGLVENKEATRDLQLALSEFSEEIEPILTEVIQFATNLLEQFNDLNPETQKFILALIAFAAVAPSILNAIGTISTATSGLKTTFNGSGLGIVGVIRFIISALTILTTTIGEDSETINKNFSSIIDYLKGPFEKDYTESFGALGEVLNGFSSGVVDWLDALKKQYTSMTDFLAYVYKGKWEDAWDSLAEAAETPFEMAKATIKGVINSAIGMVNFLIRKINSINIPIFGNTSISTIPFLANGGVLSQGSAVVGEAGPELLTVYGSKAIVQPLTQSNTTNTNNSFGGITVNVYSNGDISDTAERIAEEIQQAVMRKGMVFA